MSCRKALVAGCVLGSGLFVLAGEQAEPSAIFTAAQAEAGRAAMENTCAKCHTPSLLGRKGGTNEAPALSSLPASYQKFIGPRGFVPPLAGETFINRYGSMTAAQLISRLRESVDSFPPEGRDQETAVNITAYVLQMNGARAGNQALTKSSGVVVSSVTR
jgi:cytochrome c